MPDSSGGEILAQRDEELMVFGDGYDAPDHRDDQNGYEARDQIIGANLQSAPRNASQQTADALAGQQSRVDDSTRDAGQEDKDLSGIEKPR